MCLGTQIPPTILNPEKTSSNLSKQFEKPTINHPIHQGEMRTSHLINWCYDILHASFFWGNEEKGKRNDVVVVD